MRFASLGSGSRGNALLVSAASGTVGAAGTTIMVDCGFGIRETEQRLARLGMLPEHLSAIMVTHEHQDHIGGVFKFARRHRIPVWLTYGTFQAAGGECAEADIHFCRDGEPVTVGDLQLFPYTVPHDAREPVQYVASDGSARLGVLTDAGHATRHMLDALGGCDALMLECNHDIGMLANSGYPYSLKQRIGGAYGHLSNKTSGEILAALDRSRLRTVVGAHLSLQNNLPELAREALYGALSGAEVNVAIACQEEGFPWIEVKSLSQ